MEKLLIFREKCITLFKKYELIILSILKFLIGFFVFYKIMNINMFNELFVPYINNSTVLLISIGCGLLFTVMPSPLSFLLLTLIITFSISLSVEVAIIVFIFFFLILIFYVSLASKESYFILFTILAFYFKIPYLIPIIAGLYFSVTTIIPISIGIFIWRSIPVIESAIHANTSSTNIIESITDPGKSFAVYSFITKGILSNQLWLSEALIFSLVVILVYIVSKLSFDYAKDIGIIIGGLLNIIGFLIIIILIDLKISVLTVLIGSIICVLLALIIRFFDNVLDYEKVENLEFSDDDYYYYVKAIPKVKLEIGQKANRKRFSSSSIKDYFKNKKDNKAKNKEDKTKKDKFKKDANDKDKKVKDNKDEKVNTKVNTKEKTKTTVTKKDTVINKDGKEVLDNLSGDINHDDDKIENSKNDITKKNDTVKKNKKSRNKK